MVAVTSIDNSVNMLNRFNTAIQNNIAIQNRLIQQTQQNIDLRKQSYKYIDKVDKSQHFNTHNTRVNLNFITQVTREVETKEKMIKDPEVEKPKKKILKMVPKLALQGLQNIFNPVKKIWDGWLGKGLKLGISKDPEIGGMLSGITEKWHNTWTSMGTRIAPLLKPILSKISGLMDSQAFQNMVKVIEDIVVAIVQGLTVLMGILEPVIGWVGKIFGVLAKHSDTVIITLFILIGVLGVLTVATAIYNAVLNANPAMLIVQAILILISVFIALIATLEPVRKAIADMTRVFFDFIEWGINGLIEALAAALEGIIKFAGDGINTFLDIFVNPFIDGINMIISGLNFLGGSFDKISHMKVNFTGVAEATSTYIRSRKVDLSGAKEAVAGAIESFSADKLKAKLGISKLEEEASGDKPVKTEVTKMSDDVNITDEDIKLMREVAEREMIQNFVTLTPTVSMGDMTVNENADADRLLGKITEALVTEVANSAQGVYA